MAHDDRHHAEGGPQGQRAHVPHEDLGRIGVEPQKAEARTDQRPAEHGQLPGERDVGNLQVLRELHVPDQVRDEAEGGPHHHGREDRVGQVHRIAGAHDHEVGDDDETDAQRNGHLLEERHDEGGLDGKLRRRVEKHRGSKSCQRLPQVLPAGDEALTVLP